MRAVDGGDDHDPDDVIDDREREQVGAHPVGQAGADQREHAQGERGIRGHRRAPAGGRRAARVDGQVDGDRNDHPANPDQHRKREPPPFSQLAHVELAARLEPGDQEEERHQPGVDPAVQIVGHARAADPDRQPRVPARPVRGWVRVRPDQRGDRGGQQNRGAAGLGAQELAQRCLASPLPRGAERERRSGQSRGGHFPILPRGSVTRQLLPACLLFPSTAPSPPAGNLPRTRVKPTSFKIIKGDQKITLITIFPS